jgi:hypothetical protein
VAFANCADLPQHSGQLQVFAVNYPGGTLDHLFRGQNAFPDQTSNHGITDAQLVGGLFQSKPAVAFTDGWNLMRVAQTGNP